MQKIKIIKNFKGGSLSSTSLIKTDKNELYVRKNVSLLRNREYGFQRWYSQLKKIQRYNVTFPNMFPLLYKYGQYEKMAYFDIEYFENAYNAHDFLFNCIKNEEIDSFFEKLIDSMSVLHNQKMSSCEGSLFLYINEEIEQRLFDCNKNNKFMNFLEYEYLMFNGQRVKSFIKCLDEYKDMFANSFKNPTECFTHGNITLENILYIPNEKRIILIDPYEENIIDSDLAEMSQLLQSSNSKYELYNSLDAEVVENTITLEIGFNYGINYFNNKMLEYIKGRYSFNDYIVIRLLEISQFIRMLPFKMEIDHKKMFFFYGLASKLFEDLKIEYKRGIINESR